MHFESYITSETKAEISLPLTCPPAYKIKGFGRFLKKLKSKNFGFTLAETLITLTIIGVVAAMTIPTLISKYQKHQYVVGLKKAYANLQNAVQMTPISENCSAGDWECAGFFDEAGHVTNIDEQDFNNDATKKRFYLISKQLKVVKKDFSSSSDFCKKWNTNTLKGCFYTADGMIFGIREYLGYIIVDINGEKGPNKNGRDRFAFYLAQNSNPILVPKGSQQEAKRLDDPAYYWRNNQYCKTAEVDAEKTLAVNSGSTHGDWCTGRVLEEGAMNY